MAPYKKKENQKNLDSDRKTFRHWCRLLKKGKADGSKISEDKITQLDMVVHDDEYYYLVYSKVKMSKVTELTEENESQS